MKLIKENPVARLGGKDNGAKENSTTAGCCESHINSPTSQVQDNSAANQRQRILEFLRSGDSLTTLQARHDLDIMHPGMRVCELRKSGDPIETHWVEDLTPEGGIHRVARYILASEAQGIPSKHECCNEP